MDICTRFTGLEPPDGLSLVGDRLDHRFEGKQTRLLPVRPQVAEDADSVCFATEKVRLILDKDPICFRAVRRHRHTALQRCAGQPVYVRFQ